MTNLTNLCRIRLNLHQQQQHYPAVTAQAQTVSPAVKAQLEQQRCVARLNWLIPNEVPLSISFPLSLSPLFLSLFLS